eukprot:43474-Ditylum_brightwellii.AAC.1
MAEDAEIQEPAPPMVVPEGVNIIDDSDNNSTDDDGLLEPVDPESDPDDPEVSAELVVSDGDSDSEMMSVVLDDIGPETESMGD